MSTNKTTNYRLHSWVPQDEFHVSEINENFAALDAALKAEAGSREALAELLNSYPRMVTGSYMGKSSSDKDTQTITEVELGFKPKAVITVATIMRSTSKLMAFVAIEDGYTNSAVTLTETGFTARNSSEGLYANYSASTIYHYIAIY